MDSLAVQYERQVYSGASLEEVNAALMGKAECYKMLGRYSDASATLARVRMFALTPEERQELLFQQELCWFMDGDFKQAASLVEEVGDGSQDALLLHALVLAYAGRYDESEIYAARCVSWDGPCERLGELLKYYGAHPRVRSAQTAMALAFVPPLGHLYNGAWGEGLLSLGLNSAAAGFTVANLLGGYWITGIVGGGILLNYTFMGNQQRNAELVSKHNRRGPMEFGDGLRALLSDILSSGRQRGGGGETVAARGHVNGRGPAAGWEG
ncbi:MAG: hypothetical protein J6O51_05970 [Bacteroidales bacterium]|nr:hypothetical protein [Bacteroidales bacterium]